MTDISYFLNQHPENTAQTDISLIGECMIELSGVPLSPLNQRFSGDTLNTAIYLRRLLKKDHFHVHYGTAIGTDAFSRAMTREWQKEGILVDLVLQYNDKTPGMYYIELDEQGERSFSYWRNDSAAKQYLARDEWPAIERQLSQHQLIYLSGISLAILPPASRDKLFKFVRAFRNRGGKLAFDNNYRPLLWQSKAEARAEYERFMSECDLALLTFDDEKLLDEEVTESNLLERCVRLGITEVVIKRGPAPAIVQHTGPNQSTTCLEIEAEPVKTVVDTTAAGDSFSAAYLAARLSGQSCETAASWGHQLAALVIQHHGAIIDKNLMPRF